MGRITHCVRNYEILSRATGNHADCGVSEIAIWFDKRYIMSIMSSRFDLSSSERLV